MFVIVVSRAIMVCKVEDVGTRATRVFSRTIRRLEPSRRCDAGFLNKVKGPPWDAQDGIVQGSTERGICTTTTPSGRREHSD